MNGLCGVLCNGGMPEIGSPELGMADFRSVMGLKRCCLEVYGVFTAAWKQKKMTGRECVSNVRFPVGCDFLAGSCSTMYPVWSSEPGIVQNGFGSPPGLCVFPCPVSNVWVLGDILHHTPPAQKVCTKLLQSMGHALWLTLIYMLSQ